MMAARRGFSLLEMLLALAVLGASLAVLSQIAMTGTDAAMDAEYVSQARMIAQSRMSEMLASGLDPVAVPPTPTTPVDSASTVPFEYQVDVAQAPYTGMLAVRVSVRALGEDDGRPLATYSVVRWVISRIAMQGAETL